MAITVKLTGDPKPESLTNEGAWYEFLATGVLGVHYGDDIQSPVYYAPHAWEYVSSPQPPGQKKQFHKMV
ncbi:hypothetical protein [Mycobacteroides abscessus]|uniref:hypothetical protein n=1 Tax=Mycobacteroides abscessus TaxID=36809 RepID=UPI000940B5A6|nr:hypothetical protein [Mycobacteroides abscessus]PVB44308.1 hypothetical protein DDJ39_15250 [Mycobacteroides abscessus]QSN53754.1 hypothetical protein I3U39_08785 [Mycobacteroides abscessus subsp. abscessus]